MTERICGGVDYNAHQVCLALVGGLRGPETAVVATKDVPSGKSVPETLRLLGTATEAAYREAVAMYAAASGNDLVPLEPSTILVEQPSSFKNVPKRMLQAEGVILAALSELTYVDDIPPATWRAEILGKGTGNIKREKVKEIALHYARKTFGYAGEKDDPAEALCIAEYAYRMES